MMKKFQCSICGHIYDPSDGDPTQNIAPDTPFEQVPDTWNCPTCGAEKSQFREIA